MMMSRKFLSMTHKVQDLKGFNKEKRMSSKIRFTCASATDGAAQTVRTSQFAGLNFKDGQRYKITFSNGKSAVGKVSRNGTTLYISEKEFLSVDLKAAVVGTPVDRLLKSIKKVK